jgi:hypothetical protein
MKGIKEMEIRYAPMKSTLEGTPDAYAWKIRAGAAVADRTEAYRRGVSLAGEDGFHIAVIALGSLVEVLDPYYRVAEDVSHELKVEMAKAVTASGQILGEESAEIKHFIMQRARANGRPA